MQFLTEAQERVEKRKDICVLVGSIQEVVIKLQLCFEPKFTLVHIQLAAFLHV